jgi:methyl-accepting chemotaxis protein
MAKHEKQSELIAAATALDEELQRFERISENIRTTPLSSQKHLERAAELFREVGASDQELSKRLGGLVDAITHVREEQSRQAQLVQQRALEMEQRTKTFQELLEAYGTLGTGAAQLNQLVATTLGGSSGKPERTPELEEGIDALESGMHEVAAAAEKLASRATEADFPDIERLATSLRQQLLSTKNRLGLLRKQLGIPSPAQA